MNEQVTRRISPTTWA